MLKSLAEAHHGDLWVEDAVGGGSSFVLSLPLEKVNVEPEAEIIEAQSEEDGEATVSEFSGKKFTVLLVEDNVDLLNLTRESLSVWFRVLKATNGIEALEVLSRESVDVIVSDVMMPGNGWIRVMQPGKERY